MQSLTPRQTPSDGQPTATPTDSTTLPVPSGDPATSSSVVPPPIESSSVLDSSSSLASSVSISSSSDSLSSVSSTSSESSSESSISHSSITHSSSTETELLTTTSEETSATSSTTETSSFTTVVTSVNGRLTTFTSALPTSLIAESNTDGSDPRTGLIAGLTSALVILLMLLLGAAFAYRRHRHRRQLEVLAAEKKRKEGRSLLDGEGFDDEDYDAEGVAMRSYGEPSPLRAHYQTRSISPTLSILRSRASETGSIFREDVWPPPADELVDPIMVQSSQVDLGRVVEDVMGPESSRRGTDSSTDSSSPLIKRSSFDRESFYQPYPSFTGTWTFGSDGLAPMPPPPAMMTTIGSTSIALRRPPSPNTYPSSSSLSLSPPSSPLVGLPPGPIPSSSRSPPPPRPVSTVPRKSSPLARRLSQDAKIWLFRSAPNAPPAGVNPKHSSMG